jgi:hypothetical protein
MNTNKVKQNKMKLGYNGLILGGLRGQGAVYWALCVLGGPLAAWFCFWVVRCGFWVLLFLVSGIEREEYDGFRSWSYSEVEGLRPIVDE